MKMTEAKRKAIECVLRDRRASISYIQRRVGVGYNTAATIMDSMVEDGLVSDPDKETGRREIYMTWSEYCRRNSDEDRTEL